MRTIPLCVALCALLAGTVFGGTTITPTTTLTAETSNNTSTANSFTAQSNGNLGAGNISKVDSRTLLYGGPTTRIYAHFMGWFGQSNHMDVGYTSSDPTQVEKQVSDALSRGITGFILDWYGPNNTMPNNTAFALKSEAEKRGGAFQFQIQVDGGALKTCAATAGCDLTQTMIDLLTYAWNNFEQSSAYMYTADAPPRPIVSFFDPDRYGTLDWNRIQSAMLTQGNPAFIFRNSGGFTHTATDGSFAWVIINTSNANDWSQSYLDNFYSKALTYPTEHTFGATYKGFNDTLAAWGSNRIMNQNCAQTWVSTFSEIGKYYSSVPPNPQLEAVQLVTWNDYEEGTELESGVDNCVTISAAMSAADQISWTITGSEATIDHYAVFISTDGENLMSLGDIPAGTHTLNLAPFAFDPGSYTLYVKAVGRPSLANHMSAAVSYVPSAPADHPPTAVLSVSPTSGLAPLTVTASTSGSTDSDGTIVSSSINFGDGTIVSGATATHTYSAAGNYLVTGTVTDNAGLSSSATQTVGVTAPVDQPPTAVLTVSPTSGMVPLTVNASTSGSTDSDGTVVSSSINFGDGTLISGFTATHTYSSAGTYTVTGTVTDNNGLSSSATQIVTVTAPVSGSVNISTPNNGQTVKSPVHIVASASGTNPIVSMAVYVDNNTSPSYTTAAAKLNIYVAMSSGARTITVIASDTMGNVFQSRVSVSVR